MKKVVSAWLVVWSGLFMIASLNPMLAQTPLAPVPDRQMYVSEYLNVPGDGEWNEVLVSQDNQTITNFTVNDNNQTLTTAQGGIRFKAGSPLWQNVRRGTIIVIHHRSTATLDQQIRDGYVELNSGWGVLSAYTVNTVLDSFTRSNPAAPGSQFNVAGNGDILEINNASGIYVHSLGHINGGTAGSYWTGLPSPSPPLYKPIALNTPLGNDSSIALTGSTWAQMIGGLPPVALAGGTKGLPNSAINRVFWRQLRQPDWTNTTLSNTPSFSPAGAITLQWNSMVDPFPADTMSGYIVLRRRNGAFNLPAGTHDFMDGQNLQVGSVVNGDTVVAFIRGSNNTTFTDNNIPCGMTVSYRVYAWRFDQDDLLRTDLALGRAYNETQFVSATFTREFPPAISIVPSVTSATICQGTPLTLNTQITPTTTATLSYRWTRNGTQVGTASSLPITQDGSYTVEVRLSPDNGCVNSSSLTVAFTPSPTLGLDDDDVCQNTPVNVATFLEPAPSPTGGVLEWDLDNDGVFDETAQAGSWQFTTPGDNTIRARYTVNGCVTTASTEVTVIAESIPTVAVAPPGPYCSGTTVTVTVTLSAPAQSLIWNFGDGSPAITTPGNQLTRTHTYATAGTFPIRVTANNGICQRTSADVPVTITATPDVSLQFVNNTCINSPVTFSATALGATTVTWNFGAGATPATHTGQTPPPVVYSTAGPKTVTVTAINGTCTSTASRSFIVFERVSVSFPTPNIGICAGGSTPLTPTITGGSSNLSYQWTPATGLSANNIANPTATPAANTTYTLTVTDNNAPGCSSSASVQVTINPNLVVTGVDTTICGGATAVLRIANPVSSYQYTWRSGASTIANTSTATVTPTATTTYQVDITDAATGCAGTGTVVVTVAPAFTVNAGADQTRCLGSTVALNAQTSRPAQTSYTYQWTPSTGLSANNIANPVYTATAVGSITFTVTVTEATTGCSFSDQVTLTTVPALNISLPPTAGICAGSSITLQPTINGGSGNFSYQWVASTGVAVPSVSNPTVTPSAPTVYTLTVTDNTGNCTAVTAQSVQITPSLQVLSVDTTICAGTVNLQSYVRTPTGPGYSYAWRLLPAGTTINNPTTYPIAAGTTVRFLVTATDNASGCQGTDTLLLIAPPALSIQSKKADTTICGNAIVSLFVNVNGGSSPANLTYSWTPTRGLDNPASRTPTATVADSATYTVLIKDILSGCEITTQVRILRGNAPVIRFQNISNDTLIVCQGDSVALPTILENATIFLWDASPDIVRRDSLRPVVRPTQTTTYTLRAENPSCQVVKSITVVVVPRPALTVSSPENFVGCEGATVRLNAVSPGAVRYQWSTGESTASISVTRSGRYDVTAFSTGGCRVTQTVTVQILPTPRAEITATSSTVCVGERVWIRARLDSLTASTATFTWNNGQTGDSILVGAGTYFATVQNASCSSRTPDFIIRERLEQLTLQATNVDFGKLSQCQTDTTISFTITNSGNAPVTIRTAAQVNFSVSPAEVRLAAGETATVTIGFRPSVIGLLTGTISFTSRECGTVTPLAVRGEREDVVARVNPPTDIDFGALFSCESAPRDTVLSFQNIGDSIITVENLSVPAPFQIINNTPLPVQLNKNEELRFTVRYAPVANGNFNERVVISFRVPTCPDPLQQRFNVSGRRSPASIQALATAVDVAPLTGCESSRDTLVAFVNNGEVPLFFQNATLINGSGFAVINPPTAIQPGDTARIRIRFLPLGEGVFNGTMQLQFTPCNVSTTIALSGRKDGVSFDVPANVLAPDVLTVCADSSTNTFQVTLRGSSPTGTISGVSFTSGGSVFSVGTFSRDLQNGVPAVLPITFRPTAGGLYRDTLLLTFEPCGEQRRVALQATAIVPNITVSPTLLQFGDVEVGTESNEIFFTITNNSNLPIRIRQQDFDVLSNVLSIRTINPGLPAVLGPGVSLQIGVVYAPTAVGTIDGQQTVTGSPESILSCVFSVATLDIRGRGIAPQGLPITVVNELSPALIIGSPNETISYTLQGGYNQAPPATTEVTEFSGTLTFNPTLLRLTAVRNAFAPSWQTTFNEQRPGVVQIRTAGTQPVRIFAQGEFFDLEFQVLLGNQRETPVEFLPDTTYLNRLTGQATIANSATAVMRLHDSCKIEERLIDFGPATKMRIRPGKQVITVDVDIATDDATTIEIYSPLGIRLATVLEQHQRAGTYSLLVPAHTLAQGAYFAVLKSGRTVVTIPFIFDKE